MRFWKDVQQEKKRMEVAEETLVVDDRDSLVNLRLAMSATCCIGVRTLVTTRRCVKNGPRPVGRGDILNYV